MTRNSTGEVVVRPPRRQPGMADDGPPGVAGDGPHWPDTQDVNRPSKRGGE